MLLRTKKCEKGLEEHESSWESRFLHHKTCFQRARKPPVWFIPQYSDLKVVPSSHFDHCVKYEVSDHFQRLIFWVDRYTGTNMSCFSDYMAVSNAKKAKTVFLSAEHWYFWRLPTLTLGRYVGKCLSAKYQPKMMEIRIFRCEISFQHPRKPPRRLFWSYCQSTMVISKPLGLVIFQIFSCIFGYFDCVWSSNCVQVWTCWLCFLKICLFVVVLV